MTDQPESLSYADQPPLNQVYATSDFAQGIERGKFTERERILNLLDQALMWALPIDADDIEWDATKVITFAKRLITGEVRTVAYTYPEGETE
jgi:hypothetical protein